MALQVLRRNLQNLKWVLWIVIIALSAGMLLLFRGGFGGTAAGGLGSTELARVADYRVTPTEFRNRYARMLEIYRSNFQQNPELIKQLHLDQQVLNQLIREYAVLAEGERLGLTATADEIFAEIKTIPAFMENGQFIGIDRYKEILRRNRYSLTDFESGVRRSIVQRKLERVLTDGLEVSPEEVRQAFLERNQEVKVRYVAVNQKASVPEQVDEEALKAYFEQNSSRYQGQEKRRAWTVRIEKSPTQVEVSQQEINEFLDGSEAASVRVRDILIPVEGDEEQAKAQAEQILSEVKGGADFAAQAKEYSKDPQSAARGGDLGFIQRGARDKAFEDAAFGLKPGDSTVVKAPDGYHVIQQVEAQASQATAMAKFKAQQQKAAQTAQQEADKVVAEVRAGESLEAVAQRHGLEVQLSEPFERGMPVPGATPVIEFSNRVFSLAKEGDLTEPFVDSPGRVYLAQLAEVIPPEAMTLEQARSSVEADWKNDRGRELAEQTAKQISDEVRSGTDFADVAKEHGLDLVTTEFFKKDQSNIDDTLKFSPLLREQAFRMEPGDVGSPVPVIDNFIAFQLVEKTPVDEQKFEQEKESLKESLQEQKRSRFFNDYVSKVIENLERENEIQSNQTLLAQIVS